MKLNLVGKVVGTHGIKGELKVKSDTNFNRFIPGNKLYLKNKTNELIITIDSHRIHKGLDLIKFNNLNNINDVITYVGYEVFVDVSELDELEDNEYYYDDLISLNVYDQDENLIGKTIDIQEVPQGIILEIKKSDGKIGLVPFVDAFIVEVNVDEGYIIISPIEGLLWE